MSTEVCYSKYVNRDKGNRVEFMLINFDYMDGIDFLAKLFFEMYGIRRGDELDGIWFRTIELSSDQEQYVLLWHEDIGNEIYSLNEDDASINKLEVRLKGVLGELNRRIEAVNH